MTRDELTTWTGAAIDSLNLGTNAPPVSTEQAEGIVDMLITHAPVERLSTKALRRERLEDVRGWIALADTHASEVKLRDDDRGEYAKGINPVDDLVEIVGELLAVVSAINEG